MPWVKHDDGFSQSRKVFQLSDRAYRLHFCGLEHCARNLTDGTITHEEVPIICATARITGRGSSPKRYLDELVKAHLWSTNSVGYAIHDYLEHNPTAEQVKRERKRNADRQRRHREAKGAVEDSLSNAVTNTVTDGVTNGVSNGAPPHPTLYEGNSPSTSTRDAADEGRDINLEEGRGHALRLLTAMREEQPHRGSRIREQLLAYVGTVAPADFETVREQMLERRHEIKSDGGWALKALERIAREHSAVA